jgi:hypothetical protein
LISPHPALSPRGEGGEARHPPSPQGEVDILSPLREEERLDISLSPEGRGQGEGWSVQGDRF